LREFLTEDPFGVFQDGEGDGGGSLLASLVTVEDFSKIESFDGTTRIRSRVRIGKESTGDFFFLNFEYDRRPQGRSGGEGGGKGEVGGDGERKDEVGVIRPLSYGMGTFVTYAVTLSEGYTVEPPLPLLIVEIDAKRDRPNKKLLPQAFEEEGEGEEGDKDEEDEEADRYVVFADPTECGAFEKFGTLFEKQGFQFDNDAPLIYLLMCFQYYDLEWNIQKVMLEGLLGMGEEGSDIDSDSDSDNERNSDEDADEEIAESPVGEFAPVD